MALSSEKVVLYVVAFFLAAVLMPIAISTIANATTTNWDASTKTIFQTVFPIIVVIGLAVSFLYEMKSGGPR